MHLNSTIVSGSWWEIRHALGAAVADKLVYKTLTQYLGELDQFVDVRNATVAAAQDTPGLSADDVQTVEDAFRHHGIVDDWELTELGVDFHPLHTILGFPFIFPRVANGSWYASDIASPRTSSRPSSPAAHRPCTGHEVQPGRAGVLRQPRLRRHHGGLDQDP